MYYEDDRNKAAMIGIIGQMLYNIHNIKQNMILKFQDKWFITEPIQEKQHTVLLEESIGF